MGSCLGNPLSSHLFEWQAAQAAGMPGCKRCSGITGNREPRGKRFEAPMASAWAGRAVAIQQHMPNFTGPATFATVERAIDNDTTTNTRACCHIEHVLHATPSPQPIFGQRSCITIICDTSWNIEPCLDPIGERCLFPTWDMHGEPHNTTISTNRAAKTDANANQRTRVSCQQVLGKLQHGRETCRCPA